MALEGRLNLGSHLITIVTYMEGYIYVAGGLILLIVFPFRYIYVHYIKQESHVMVITHHYQSHWLLELMRKVAFGIAFFGSFVISVGAIWYGLRVLMGL